MQGDDFTLDFQVGTTKEAHRILGKLAGRSGAEEKKKSDNPKAPFDSMADAYLFAIILGLTTGNKKEVKDRKNYANFTQTVAKDIDMYVLLKSLGEPSDIENQKAAQKAIEEYATWGLMRLDSSKLGQDDYRIGRLLEDITAENSG